MIVNLILISLIVFVVIAMIDGLTDDGKPFKSYDYKLEDKYKKQAKLRCQEILKDYREMKNDNRFQNVMYDLENIIDANINSIQYIELIGNTISIRLQDWGDKWDINPTSYTGLDLGQYKLKFNHEALIYWILLEYSFLTYHVKENKVYETRKLHNVVLEPDNASTIIYRIGAQEKYWK